LKVGLFALDPDWVTSPVLDAYVHSALDNSLYLNVGRVPFNPAVAPGFQVSWTPGGAGEWGTWQLGGFWLEPVDELGGLFGVIPACPPPGAQPSCCSGAMPACRGGSRPSPLWPTTVVPSPGSCPPLLQLGDLLVRPDNPVPLFLATGLGLTLRF
jgi:hypothetical protein